MSLLYYITGHTDLAIWLIGRGADVNKAQIGGQTTLFEEAVKRDQVQVGNIIICLCLTFTRLEYILVSEYLQNNLSF